MQTCLQLYEELAAADLRNVYYQRSASKAHYRLGNLDLLEERPDDARAHFERASGIRETSAAIDPKNDRRQMELMLAQAQMGRVDEAVAIADRLAARPNVDPELRMDLARCYAIASRTLPASESQRAETLRIRALDCLRAAVKNGYRDRGYLEGEPDFAPLQAREEFKALVGGIQRKDR
jgi:tetratricopeptide (TPR) repeat protein